MKLFSDADERTAAVTILAGLLVVADVLNRGYPVDDETDERLGKAFQLAGKFVERAESEFK